MKKSLEKTIYVLMPLLVYILATSILSLTDRYIIGYMSLKSPFWAGYVQSHGAAVSIVLSGINSLIEAWIIIRLMKRDAEELALGDYLNVRGLGFYRMNKRRPAYFSWLIIGITGLSFAIGLNILVEITGLIEASEVYEAAASSIYSSPVWLGLPYVILVSPMIEELVYRLVIYGRLKRRFPLWIAIVCSSLFFGVMHGNLVQGIYAFFMGILMCMACEYVHSIWGSFCMHSLANLCIYLLSITGSLKRVSGVLVCAIALGTGLICLGIEAFGIYKNRINPSVELTWTPVGCFRKPESNGEEYGG